MEGGGLEVNGAGLAVAMESCIINDNRNPGKDKAQIEARTKTLEEAGQSLYAAVAAAGQAGEAGGEPSSQHAGEDVVDAEFTEVKDDEEKK